MYDDVTQTPTKPTVTCMSLSDIAPRQFSLVSIGLVSIGLVSIGLVGIGLVGVGLVHVSYS
jgi:hypothetical protein